MRLGAIGLVAVVVAAPVFCSMAQQQPAQPAAPARPAPGLSIGVVDISAILRHSTAAQGLQRQLQAEQERYQALTDQQQRALQAEEEGIERQRTTMPADVYAQRRREFEERVNRLTAEFRARRRQIDDAFNSASGEINRTLQQVIDELAQAQGIQLVVRREAVVYQQSVFDLTEAAGEALNRRLPSVSVNLPPP